MHSINSDEEAKNLSIQIQNMYNKIQQLEKNVKATPIASLILLILSILLFAVDSALLKLMGVITFVFFITIIVESIQYSKKIEEYKSIILESEKLYTEYNLKKEALKKEEEKTVFQKSLKVKGTTYRESEVNKAMNIILEYDSNPSYGGMTNKEIMEFGSKVYQYDGVVSFDFFLEREPDNKTDTFAIKVLIHNIHIGYIEKNIAREINSFIDNNEYIKKGYVSVIGGPFKSFSYADDKVEINREEKIGFLLHLKIIKK